MSEKFTKWEDIENEIYTPEEIAESDLRVALMSEIITARSERGITQKELEALDVNMKIDITPQSPYDKYAQEMSLENLLIRNYITLEEYTEALPEDSSMPKPTLETIIRKRKEARQQITAMQEQANALNSAIQQEIINQGGYDNGMSEMPLGNDGSITQGQLVSQQM